MLKLYKEAFGNRSIEILEEKILEHLEKEEKFLVLLPNRKTIDSLKERILERREVLGNLQFFTFDDVVENKRMIEDDSEYFTEILLKKAILNLQKENIVEKEGLYLSKGFLRICSQIHGYIRNSHKRVKDLLGNAIESLNTIFLVLAEYEKLLEKYGFPRNWDFDEFTRDICEKYKGYEIYIDGYFEFRPIEYLWIKEAACNNITIFFHATRKDLHLLNQTCSQLKEMGFVEEEIKSSPTPYHELSHRLFTKEKIDLPNLKILEAEDPYLEAKGICQEIKRQYLSGNSFHKMTIVLKEKEQGEIISKQLEKENIPYQYKIKKPLLQFSFYKELYRLLTPYKNTKDYLFANAINKEILEIDDSQCLFLKYTIHYYDYEKVEDYYKIQEIGEHEERGILFQTLEKLAHWKKIIEDGEDKQLFEEIISLLEDRLAKSEEKNIYRNYLLFLKKITTQYGRFFESLTEKEKIEFLLASLENFHIDSYIPPVKGVKLLPIRQLRLFPEEILFFPDIIDKNYPSGTEYNYFINEKTIDEMKNLRIEIQNREESFERDKIVFLTALSTAEKSIYFSYCKGDLPSYYLKEILKHGEVEIENYKVKDFIKPNINQISTYSDLKKYNGLRNEKKSMEEKEKVFYLKNRFSVSELETYSLCPAKYNYKYCMKLEPSFIDPQSMELRSLGNICHQLLETFYKYFNKEIRKAIQENIFDWSGKKAFIEENIYYLASKEGFNIEISRIQMELGIYIKHLLHLIRKDIDDLMEKKLFYPTAFEERVTVEHRFNHHGKTHNIHIRGIIDRIDQSIYGDKVLIDYKLGSSVKEFNDFKRGHSLQFPIYNLAVNAVSCKYLSIKKEESTIFYLKSEEDKGKNILNEEEYLEMQIETRKRIDTILENIGNQIFEKPTEDLRNCNYCDYRRICRERREG